MGSIVLHLWYYYVGQFNASSFAAFTRGSDTFMFLDTLKV
jgi:hypothetical protein